MRFSFWIFSDVNDSVFLILFFPLWSRGESPSASLFFCSASHVSYLRLVRPFALHKILHQWFRVYKVELKSFLERRDHRVLADFFNFVSCALETFQVSKEGLALPLLNIGKVSSRFKNFSSGAEFVQKNFIKVAQSMVPGLSDANQVRALSDRVLRKAFHRTASSLFPVS